MQKISGFLNGLPWDEFGKIIVLIKGTAIGRAGFVCLLAGIAGLTSPWQAVLFASLRKYGLDVQEWPLWISLLIGVGLVLLGVWLLMWNVRRGTKAEDAPPTDHDLDLYAKFRALMTDNYLTFFREHSFANSFDYSRTDELNDLRDSWRGARRSFNDNEVNIAFVRVKEAAADLANAIEEKADPVQPGSNTAIIDKYRHMSEFDVPQEYYDTVNEINGLSRRFVSSVDAFEEIATARLYRSAPARIVRVQKSSSKSG